MRRLYSLAAAFFSILLTAQAVSVADAEAYDAKPKLVVIVVIDQFRGDYLQRYRSELKGRGFRLLLDEGAWFPDCYYNYANTKTAPGHATIGTGAYSDGHGINSTSGGMRAGDMSTVSLR
jgi:predicted AlkP superfamily pyrophosphatase or phosphodiesterase